MTCEKCGICCYTGFFNSEEVAKGIINLEPESVIKYLRKKGIDIQTNDSYESVLEKIKPYEQRYNPITKPCLFLQEKKCVIHPSILSEEIRGKVCTIEACDIKTLNKIIK